MDLGVFRGKFVELNDKLDRWGEMKKKGVKYDLGF